MTINGQQLCSGQRQAKLTVIGYLFMWGMPVKGVGGEHSVHLYICCIGYHNYPSFAG